MQVLMLVLTISERGRYDKLLGLEIRNQGSYLTMFYIIVLKALKTLEKEFYYDQKNKCKKYCL